VLETRRADLMHHFFEHAMDEGDWLTSQCQEPLNVHYYVSYNSTVNRERIATLRNNSHFIRDESVRRNLFACSCRRCEALLSAVCLSKEVVC
jgi:hypothetical protein